MSTHNTVIIEDERILKDLLLDFLTKHPDYEVLETCGDGLEGWRRCQELKPDLILSDFRLPSLNGIEITRRVKAELPDSQIVLFSAHFTKVAIQQALQAGVDGMIEKTASLQEMIDAIEGVVRGEPHYGKLVLSMMRDLMMSPGSASPLDLLTDREREVVQLIAEGLSTREVAERLQIGIKTAETHRTRIMHKMDFRGVADITRFAIEQGLVHLNMPEEEN